MRVDIDDPEIDVDIGQRYTYRGQPFTGELYETDASGCVVVAFGVRNGIPDGPHREWFPDGRTKADPTIVTGVATGTSRVWHPNGQLAEEREFDDDGRLLVVRRWDEDGSHTTPGAPR